MYRYGGPPSQPVTASSTGVSLGVSGAGLSLFPQKSTFNSPTRNSKSFSILISSHPLIYFLGFHSRELCTVNATLPAGHIHDFSHSVLLTA
jgi:hypothetical protein